MHQLIAKKLEEHKGDERAALSDAFQTCDDQFIAARPQDRSGTTAVVALFEPSAGKVWIAHVGDSRAVLCTEGKAQVLTQDHKPSVEAERKRIRDAGGFVINRRVMGELAVSRAIGDSDFKEPSCKLVVAEPDVTEAHTISAKDQFYVIACDGLFDVMTNQEVCDFVLSHTGSDKSLGSCVEDLVHHAIEDLRTRDNVSVIIAQLHPNKAAASAAISASPKT
jgi:serine/threonine protein phosphatase PrpC